MKELIEAVEKQLKTPSNETFLAVFSNELYTAVPFSAEHFTKILPHSKKHQKTVFIDGGQTDLITTPSFCLSLVRVAYVIYERKKRIKTQKTECYVLVSTLAKEDVSYNAKIFPIRGFHFPKEESFYSFDKTICTGKRRASPSQVVNVMRRFAELDCATHLCDVLHPQDLIVLDGNLQSTFTGEDQHLLHLSKQATKNKIAVVGLSKTSTLFSSLGTPYALELTKRAPSHAWRYTTVADTSDAVQCPHICFVKLHDNAKHVFMVESFEPLTESIIQQLHSTSHDPIFLGYPYGLIDVDRQARVSKQEASFLKTKLLSLFDKKKLENHTTLLSAHDILDSV